MIYYLGDRSEKNCQIKNGIFGKSIFSPVELTGNKGAP